MVTKQRVESHYDSGAGMIYHSSTAFADLTAIYFLGIHSDGLTSGWNGYGRVPHRCFTPFWQGGPRLCQRSIGQRQLTYLIRPCTS